MLFLEFQIRYGDVGGNQAALGFSILPLEAKS